jgi:hypothetical protein
MKQRFPLSPGLFGVSKCSTIESTKRFRLKSLWREGKKKIQDYV